MVEKTYEDISVAAQRYSGLSRRALEYGLLQKRIMDRAKGPGYLPDEWHQLRELVDVENFERVGNFKEVMTYDSMIEFLQKWCLDSHWEGSFKRVTEHDNVAILELEERVTYQSATNVVNSVTVYEFNPDGKLRHLDVNLQMQPPEYPNPAYT